MIGAMVTTHNLVVAPAPLGWVHLTPKMLPLLRWITGLNMVAVGLMA